MKCDELEKWYAGQFSPSAVVYGANEVDEAITELKQKLHDVDNQWNEQCKEIAQLKAKLAVLQSFYDLHGNVDNYIDRLKAENESLKAKLESVQASAYADSVDSGMRERMLRRALWIARAYRAMEKIAWFRLWNGSISTMDPEDGARQEYDKWKKNLGKCLKKADLYK